VRQTPDHGVACNAFAAAAAAPPIRGEDPAGQHRPVWLESLPDDFESELIEPTERGQVRTSEGSVRHVEVFQMGGVRTSIFGRPRRLPGIDAPPGATPSSMKSPDTGGATP
jgi:hypothetical protein